MPGNPPFRQKKFSVPEKTAKFSGGSHLNDSDPPRRPSRRRSLRKARYTAPTRLEWLYRGPTAQWVTRGERPSRLKKKRRAGAACIWLRAPRRPPRRPEPCAGVGSAPAPESGSGPCGIDRGWVPLSNGVFRIAVAIVVVKKAKNRCPKVVSQSQTTELDATQDSNIYFKNSNNN